ncbi:hypothetical protein [Quadrisphaera granulorum]|nr:hypothetical protein [Quadrisphaera granulorum]
MLRQLPQPFKTLYAATFAVFFIGFVTVAIADEPDGFRFVIVPFGLLMAAQGTVLALDVRGNATEYSRLLKTTKPMGVDYSGSFMSSVRAIRMLGAAVLVVGLFMTVAAVVGT